MESRKRKKAKTKAKRERQKQNREKNKKILNDPIFLFDLERADMSEFDGVRAFIIVKTSEIISNIKKEKHNDEEIKNLATTIGYMAKDPEAMYNIFLNNHRHLFSREEFRRIKIISKNKDNELNSTEKAFIYQEAKSICLEYMMKNTDVEGIDYGAIKVCFSLINRTLMNRLEDRKIRKFQMVVDHDDELVDINVDYSDCNDKYNIKKRYFIFTEWIPTDTLSNDYSICKAEYKGFCEDSLKRLATVMSSEKQHDIRIREMNMISYTSMALSYLIVLESELRNLIIKISNTKKYDIKFIDCIEYLRRNNVYILSSEDIIKDIDNLRKVRNFIAHGGSISIEKFNEIKNLLTGNHQILNYISWNLCYEKLESGEDMG